MPTECVYWSAVNTWRYGRTKTFYLERPLRRCYLWRGIAVLRIVMSFCLTRVLDKLLILTHA